MTDVAPPSVARLAAARKIVDRCHGYNEAVRAVVDASRRLWDYFVQPLPQTTDPNTKKHRSRYRPLGGTTVEAIINRVVSAPISAAIDEAMRVTGLCRSERPIPTLSIQALDPRTLARALLGSLRTDADLRYATMRSIRLHYQLPLSEGTVRYWIRLADTLSEILKEAAVGGDDTAQLTFSELEDWRRQFADAVVADSLSGQHPGCHQAAGHLADCFLEACRAVGYLSLSADPNQVRFRTTRLDSEHLVSHLFGVPTNISGLDELFGGGGMVLPEPPLPERPDPLGLARQQLPARIIVISGARGTGKTILASQIASEIAARGGVSWLMPLEQTPGECLFALESMGGRRTSNAQIAIDFSAAATALEQWHEDRGALLILKPGDRRTGEHVDGEKQTEHFSDFLTTVEGTARSLSCGNVRLVVVDPLNSRVPPAESSCGS